MPLTILYQDAHLVAINKPAGTLVHRGERASHGRHPILQQLRDQIGQTLYPVHRLDKATSGVLLFALDSDTASRLVKQWGEVNKRYLAVVRGHLQDTLLDLPLAPPRDRFDPNWTPGPEKPAQTRFTCLAQAELAIAIDKYPSSRYSLVCCEPLTGRKHQIRRHLRHLGHPILCDTRYGKNRHYHYFRDHFGINRMLLHCQQLQLTHPVSKASLVIEAPLDDLFQSALARLDWSQHRPG
ncbi:pseudouridine synthase [Ferrimonas marina]|uniref:tRNA pseudouridine synthase C n=1 Tax=Ferrimonas marina TaxID=299255 RepID=A0A1M5NW49_9GAMM|nr:pseudouridine synthase [Ferrimonas marina]SHG93806.1 tRNA pseudouridine65 synthase [Ferrimonas marina]